MVQEWQLQVPSSVVAVRSDRDEMEEQEWKEEGKEIRARVLLKENVRSRGK